MSNDKAEVDKVTVCAFLVLLITDSICCLHAALKEMNLLGLSYTMNYSMIARTHKYLSTWCRRYHEFLEYEKEDGTERIKTALEEYLGVDNVRFVSEQYHIQEAIRHFDQVVETHTEGKVYQSFIESMYYLNDDYADERAHFHAALERFRINSGNIRLSLATLRRRVTT